MFLQLSEAEDYEKIIIDTGRENKEYSHEAINVDLVSRLLLNVWFVCMF